MKETTPVWQAIQSEAKHIGIDLSIPPFRIWNNEQAQFHPQTFLDLNAACFIAADETKKNNSAMTLTGPKGYVEYKNGMPLDEHGEPIGKITWNR